MNFQTAAIVAGVAFVLSFLSGLVGGVPFFDIFLRALLWAVVGFGGSLGVESLLRALVPDLFLPSEEAAAEPEALTGQAVNITLEDDVPVRGGFVEEVDQDEPPTPRATPLETVVSMAGQGEATSVVPEGEPRVPAAVAGETDEEMPEIGSFLDAFKPEAPESEEGASAPEYGEYSPVEPERRAPSGEVTIDGEVQDPAILAKAVQTVMKRDAQGN